MYRIASRVVTLATIAVATQVTASAQTAPPHVPLQKTFGAAKPEDVPSPFSVAAHSTAAPPVRGFVLRQDPFDRADPNNLKSDWPSPPAQPGQY
ncbi:hypothetical protein [Bradyrhizobium japonicum]|uniref:hypothetical protein n=1 Tax=Bradyrhizobium japonicum TaxID=375 RepID=UPI001BAA2D02|nr:hypothetical protein [Bradyrhizobium japonicum]MBR0955832.1 hypothetical protein [Bradyrhizobium japonicum]